MSGSNEIFDDDFGERQSVVNKKQKHYTKMTHIRLTAEQNMRKDADTLLREELNAKQLEVGAVQTDAEPVKNSANHLTSGAIAASSGYYVDNPEWIRLYVDGAKRILFGIRKNGDVDWAKGIPKPIMDEIERIVAAFDGALEELDNEVTEALMSKVDKEDGKSLIDAEFAAGVFVSDSPEFVEVHYDGNKRILFGVRVDGDFVFGCGIPSAIMDALNSMRTYFDSVIYFRENPLYAALVLDNAMHILFSIDKDGNVDWAKGVPTPIKEEMAKYHVYIESPEFVILVCDAAKHIVFGITVHGEVVGCVGNKKEDGDGNTSPDNIWKGKKIVWYGTSIPAGGFDTIRLNGSQVKYMPSYGYGDTISETDGEHSPNQYPVMTGSLLGADTVFNEAIGSCSASAHTRDTSLEILCKGMGNTVSQICGWLTDCYIIDWGNRTYQRNPNNSVGVTQFLADSTWNQLMDSFYRCIRISYQVALVSRYLIGDDAEHQAYVEDAFGEYYSVFKAGLATAGFDLDVMCMYKGDVDLFVFDHGFNDPNTVGDTMTSFEGAMTEFLSLIYMYKPYVRVVMVTDYVTLHNNKIIVERQKNLAEKWNIPIADMTKVLPVSNKVKVRTRGYWSGNVWHNEGFTFSAGGGSYSTNNSFASMLAGMGLSNTLENVMTVFNPRQIGSDWYWDAYPLCLWMQDALHPHSDKNGRLTILYARYLTGFLSNIGNSYNQ